MRNAIGLLLRLYAYLYHLLLALFLLGIGLAALANSKELNLGMLPWEGAKLTWGVLVLGLVGLVCVLLAVAGFMRWLFALWALLVLGLMIRGFFLTPYTFSGSDQFWGAVWLTVGAFGAFLGSLSSSGRQSRR